MFGLRGIMDIAQQVHADADGDNPPPGLLAKIQIATQAHADSGMDSIALFGTLDSLASTDFYLI